MRRSLPLLVLLLAFAATTAVARSAAKSKSAAVAADGWPDSPAGACGRQYVTAFNAGDEAMKKFYTTAFAPESLAVRGPEKRLARYHDLREQVGTLAFGNVVKDSAGVLVVSLIDADAAPHEFTFTVDPNPPHRLRQIALKQMQHVHGGFGDFHH